MKEILTNTKLFYFGNSNACHLFTQSSAKEKKIAFGLQITCALRTSINIYAAFIAARVQSFDALSEGLPATQSLVGGDATKLSLAVHLPIHLSRLDLPSRQFNLRNGM